MRMAQMKQQLSCWQKKRIITLRKRRIFLLGELREPDLNTRREVRRSIQADILSVNQQLAGMGFAVPQLKISMEDLFFIYEHNLL